MASNAPGLETSPTIKQLSPRSKRRTSSTSILLDSNERMSRSDERLKPEDPLTRNASRSSQGTMNRASPTPGTTLKFTKTGRVSKATKGERVHACDVCGKIYTRNEHLRRHKKNHSPGQLPCDIPGCGRSFFREDLLQRHKQRHNDPGSSPYQASERLPRFGETTGAGDYTEQRVRSNTLTSNLPPETSVPTRAPSESVSTDKAYHVSMHDYSSSGANPIPHKTSHGYRPLDVVPQRRIASVANVVLHGSPAAYQDQWTPSRRHSSPIRNATPPQPYYTYQTHHALGNEAPSFDPYTYPNSSRSPTSANSAMPILSSVGEDAINNTTFTISTPSSDISVSVNPVVGPFTFDQAIMPGITSISDPHQRDLLEQIDLQTPTAGVSSTDFGPGVTPTVYQCEERYLAVYWQAIHPLWPVVHRPTFDIVTANPMLKAAMIALGAQATGDVNDLSNARMLHERCAKVLKKRTNNTTHTYRINDMQAILLVELYSIYKSRRPPTQLSAHFENVFRRVVTDPLAYPSQSGDGFVAGISGLEDMLTGMALEEQKECKRRLLISCYILDRQHSYLFGRASIECPVPVAYLPFPISSNIWDVTRSPNVNTAYGHFTTDANNHEYVLEALNLVSTSSQHATTPYDVFRSAFLVASMKDVSQGHSGSTWKPTDDAETSALLHVVDHSPRTRLAYHMFMLCKNTPIRDLLAVAGESWIMSEKLSDQAAHTAAQLETRAWATSRSADSIHHDALYHALYIIDLYRNSSTPGVLYREWALYLATLIVWITAYIDSESMVAREKIGRDGGNMPSQHELEKSLNTVIEAGPRSTVSWYDASNVLLWTQARLRQTNVPHHCGLSNGALDVIDKVVSRGHETTWLQ